MSEILAGLPGQTVLRFRVRAHPGRLEPQAHVDGRDGAAVSAATATVEPLERRGVTDHGSTSLGHRIHVAGLKPDEPYVLRVTFPDGTCWRSAPVRTLPERINGDFTIATGSCFALNKGHKIVAKAFPPREHDVAPGGIRLRFLTGDQVYLDLNTAGWPHLRRPDPWDLYDRNWHGAEYGSFLAAAPSGFLADDHEYWNNYPLRQLQIPWTWTGAQRRRIGCAADSAFELYQAALNPGPGEEGGLDFAARRFCRSFCFEVPPISFFALDTRTGRTSAKEKNACFVRQDKGGFPELEALEQWIEGLRGPGVLVLAQPMVEHPARYRLAGALTDFKLPDYSTQYLRLWTAILRSRHNVVILSGDIHVNRLSRITPLSFTGASGAAVYEVVSSALSLIDTDQGKKSPRGELKVDASGAAGWGRMLEVQHLPLGRGPSVERRSFATLSFRENGPRIACRVVYWRIESGGSVPFADWTLPLE